MNNVNFILYKKITQQIYQKIDDQVWTRVRTTIHEYAVYDDVYIQIKDNISSYY